MDTRTRPAPADDPTPAIAERLREERRARGWSLAELAVRAGVSKAMISRIERGESSPTAAILGRLSGAFQLTLAALLARAEGDRGRLVRAADQPRWRDPGAGYLRRQVFARKESPLELVEVELPAGAEVAFPASSYTFIRQLVYVLRGRLVIEEGSSRHDLRTGDCLEFGTPAASTFRNESRSACRYLVSLVRR